MATDGQNFQVLFQMALLFTCVTTDQLLKLSWPGDLKWVILVAHFWRVLWGLSSTSAWKKRMHSCIFSTMKSWHCVVTPPPVGPKCYLVQSPKSRSGSCAHNDGAVLHNLVKWHFRRNVPFPVTNIRSYSWRLPRPQCLNLGFPTWCLYELQVWVWPGEPQENRVSSVLRRLARDFLQISS